MPTVATDPLKAARAMLNRRISFTTFFEGLVPKDRPKIEKQLAGYEAAGDLQMVTLWKRLACALMTLAPYQPKVNAQHTIQFYEADGRHRKQLFALEDSGGHTLVVYCKDVLDRAIDGRLLQREAALGEKTYRIVGTPATLSIDRIDGSVIDPLEFFKHLVGWNRKALRIPIPVSAGEAQIAATETLCAMAMLAANDA